MVRIQRSQRARTIGFRLSLLGAFELTEGGVALVLSESSQRLLAYLGIHDRIVARSSVAQTLWPRSANSRARASLRTSLSRLDRVARNALQTVGLDLRLSDDVVLDVRLARALAYRLLIVDVEPQESDLGLAAIASLSSELLPDWYDDWVVLQAEHWHQLRLYALEALADKLVAVGRFGEAAEAALNAIDGEPLRETAYAALMRVQLAEGNRSEALATFARYSTLLRAELGLEPTAQLEALIADLGRA